jgi:RNA polymerase sigma-70 factor (ECF subfamily)
VAGREDGFEELVRRYQRPIAAYVYRMVGDYEAALDLTQEVFIKVYNSLRRYRPEFKFSTWIYKIAHNASVDYLRRYGTRGQAAYRELVLLRHSQDMSYDEIAEVTGLPLGTVKNRLYRARETMRQQFIQRGITSV